MKPDPRKPILINGSDGVLSAQAARDIAARNKDDSIARTLIRKVFQQVNYYASFGHESTHLWNLSPGEVEALEQVRDKLHEFGYRTDVFRTTHLEGDQNTVKTLVSMTVIWAEQEKSTATTDQGEAGQPEPGFFVVKPCMKLKCKCPHIRVEFGGEQGKSVTAKCLDCGEENV